MQKLEHFNKKKKKREALLINRLRGQVEEFSGKLKETLKIVNFEGELEEQQEKFCPMINGGWNEILLLLS